MLPVEGNYAHAERLRIQIDRTPIVGPRLWQQVVRAKIVAQATLAPDAELDELIECVELGDRSNIEAVAARRYWRVLFGEDFKRRENDDVNTRLNYGYAVLRALVARAVCAAGLHPALGLHHRDGRNVFALADDLMEPARPMIDRVVSQTTGPLSTANKRALLDVVLVDTEVERGTYKLMEAYELTCQSLVMALRGKRDDLALPRAT
jgi:CRISPR-associated protein Cas1